jgi:predicted transcriptional regulator
MYTFPLLSNEGIEAFVFFEIKKIFRKNKYNCVNISLKKEHILYVYLLFIRLVTTLKYRGNTMKTVKEILSTKGSQVWTVSEDSTVYDALKFMAEKNIGALPVVDNGNLTGIFSERDYARKVILKDKTSQNTLVKEIMSHNVICVSSERTADECMALMSDKKVRHLPVLENDVLLGIISIGDIVKELIEDKDYVIDQLVTYIKDVPSIKTKS